MEPNKPVEPAPILALFVVLVGVCAFFGGRYLERRVRSQRRDDDCIKYFQKHAPNLYLKYDGLDEHSARKDYKPSPEDYALESVYRIYPMLFHGAVVAECKIMFHSNITHPELHLPCVKTNDADATN